MLVHPQIILNYQLAIDINNLFHIISQHFRTISKFGFPGIEASKIRCGLVHSCTTDNSIIFSDQTIIGNYEPNKFMLPRSLIWGLIAAMNEDVVKT